MCAEWWAMRIVAMWARVVILMAYLVEYLVCLVAKSMYVVSSTIAVDALVPLDQSLAVAVVAKYHLLFYDLVFSASLIVCYLHLGIVPYTLTEGYQVW